MRGRTRAAPPPPPPPPPARIMPPQSTRVRHDRGTRRARACIAWMLVSLCIVSVTPRAWYSSYIDVFGDAGDRTIGARIEERIRAREVSREAVRAAKAKERANRGVWFGWFGTSASASTSERRSTAFGDNDAREGGADARNVASTVMITSSTRAEKVLSDNEKALVEGLKLRLGKVNAERDSIIYLMRKIKGEEMDHHDLSGIDENGEIDELTDDEIASAMAKLEEIERIEHKPLLKRLFG
jgi:hypothetical protein